MGHTKNENVLGLNAVHDDILANGETPAPEAEVFISGVSEVGEISKKKETVCNRISEAISDFDAATFLRDEVPNAVQIGLGPWRYAMRH